VEDNKSTLAIMSRLLRQKLGFNVVVAVSVANALQVAPSLARSRAEWCA
jgi:CheY-like chemotaxis protein